MREIRFRAWNNKEKAMLEDLNGGCGYEEQCLMDVIGDANYELMQFTGLYSKDGKEIYEGDILLVPDEEAVPVTDEGQGPIEPCDHIVPVEFRNGEFGFEVPKTDDGETGWHSFPGWDEIFDIKELTVIGNIYENKELLTN